MDLIFIIIFVLGFGVGWAALWMLIKHRESDLELVHDTVGERVRHRENNKNRILVMLDHVGEISNNDVEYLLGVSNSTAWRYLEELEEDGLVVQKGTTGRGVRYSRA